MVQVFNAHVARIGKKLKFKELFEQKCREEFEALFGSLKVSEPLELKSVIAETEVDGMKVIVRRKLGD